MFEQILDIFIPHQCCLCGRTGQILCSNCLLSLPESSNHCLKCAEPITDHCRRCRLPYSKSWQFSFRDAQLAAILNRFKFSPARSLYKPLANLLASALPVLPKNTVIVPIPTIPAHIRERGFDHTKLLARHLAKLKHCEFQPLLSRKTNSVQVGAGKTQRLRQANSAFSCHTAVSPHNYYLILDDICTTGATLEAAAKLLKEQGAKHVWVAVIAKEK